MISSISYSWEPFAIGPLVPIFLIIWLFFTTVSLLMKFTTVNSSDYLFTCYNFIPWKKRVNPDHTTFQKWETVKWALLFFLKCKKIFSFLSGFRKTYFLSGKVFLSLEKFIAQLGHLTIFIMHKWFQLKYDVVFGLALDQGRLTY